MSSRLLKLKLQILQQSFEDMLLLRCVIVSLGMTDCVRDIFNILHSGLLSMT